MSVAPLATPTQSTTVTLADLIALVLLLAADRVCGSGRRRLWGRLLGPDGRWRRAKAPRRACLINRAVAPVWEVNHVWLIFCLVIMWTAFPPAFGSIMTTLSIPLSLAVLGIILRGAGFAFRHEAERVVAPAAARARCSRSRRC